jgi:hypothetical protein
MFRKSQDISRIMREIGREGQRVGPEIASRWGNLRSRKARGGSQAAPRLIVKSFHLIK